MREVMKWPYKTKDGRIVGHVVRLESNQQGSDKPRKSIVPYFKGNNEPGIPDDLPGMHRLYGLDRLEYLEKDVLIVEGEKCAHALHGLGYQAITSLGGSGQGHLADWSALSGARRIYLLPDYDEVGLQYMKSVYDRLKALSISEIKLLPVKTAPKADICDYLKTLPELQSWNELDNLCGHPQMEAIKQKLDAYIKENVREVPSSWKFIVTKHKHKMISVNDFKAMKLPPRNMLLYPWLPEGSINMIFADRGIGKTFFSLSCALALAGGEEFLCYKADKPVSVLYLDGEMQASSMQERLNKLAGDGFTKMPLHLYTPDCQDNDYIPDLGTAHGRAQINDMIELSEAKVIFIDNISAFDRTGNENEAESWAPIQEWAVQHRKKGRALVFVHHANKEGKQRGSHKKEDVMDAVLRLKRPEDYIQGEGSTRILIHYTKARHLNGETTQDIEASLESKENLLSWKWEQGNLSYKRAVEMIKNSLSMRDIAEELGISKSTIGRWKTQAQQEGLL